MIEPTPSRRVALVTLGCTRNEVDSEELAGRLAADGWSLVADPADADWTSEIGDTTEDDTMTFGMRELDLFDLVKLVKIAKAEPAATQPEAVAAG